MALQDNLVFAHFGDSLDQDHPTANITRSNPAASNDPNVNAGVLEFDSANTEALMFHQTTGNYITAGTSDFTIAVRATITTAVSGGSTMLHIGNPSTSSDRGIEMQVDSSVSLSLRAHDRTANARVDTSNGVLTEGVPFVLVFRRASSVGTIWFDGVDETAIDQLGTRDFNDFYSDITLGAHQSGTAWLDGSLEWAVVWDRGLTDSEIINNMNETDLKAAITGGGSTVQADPKTIPVIVRVPWTKQPPAGTQIDRTNELGATVLTAFLPDGDRMVDSATSIVLNPEGGATSEGNQQGRSVRVRENASDYLHSSVSASTSDNNALTGPSTSVTIATVCRFLGPTVAARHAHVLVWDPHVWDSYGSRVSSSGNSLEFRINNTAIATVFLSSEMTAQRPIAHIGKWQANGAAELAVYDVDTKALIGSTIAGATYAGPITYASAGNGGLWVGGDSVDRGLEDTQFNLIVTSNRRWTAAQERSFVQNPWQIFKPRTVIMPVPKRNRKVVLL